MHSALGLDGVCGRDDDRSFVCVGGAPLSDATYRYFKSLDVLVIPAKKNKKSTSHLKEKYFLKESF